MKNVKNWNPSKREIINYAHCSMKTKVIGTAITSSEMVSKNTVSGETEEPVTVRVPEIAEKVLRASSKDKEHDKGESNEGITELEQTGKI